MPTKRTTKSVEKPVLRGRSKSAGRVSKSRSRTRSRSRSRRTPQATKAARTPASETKIRHRRVSSSSSESTPIVVRKTKSGIGASGDTRLRSSMLSKEGTPSRVSQRIIEKIENSRYDFCNATPSKSEPSVTRPRTVSCKFSTWIREHVRSSPLFPLITMVMTIPFFLWINLLVFMPASGNNSVRLLSAEKTRVFAGVHWPVNWRLFLEPRCLLFVLGFYIMHLVIVRFIPIGRRVSSHPDSRRLDYRCSGVVSLLVSITLFSFAQWCKMDIVKNLRPVELLPKYWFGLFGASTVLLYALTLASYLASKRLSRSAMCAHGNTGTVFVDMCVGRPIRPRWFNIDWKMAIIQSSVSATLLVIFSFAYQEWLRFGRITPTMLLISIMSAVKMLDITVFEHSGLSTFMVRYEGFGFKFLVPVLFLQYMLPLWSAVVAMRPEMGLLYNAATAEPNYYNLARISWAVLLFIVGLWVRRSSIAQKDLFWRQPSHPKFSGLKVIHGAHSTRLLAGGWFGWIRHPNYLGDLLMTIASAVAGSDSCLSCLLVLVHLNMLLERMWRIEEHCSKKHGTGWRIYTELVPYRLVPQVY